MKTIIAALLCLALVSPAFAGEYRAKYFTEKGGRKTGTIIITDDAIAFETLSGKPVKSVDPERVTKIEAGEFAKKRVKGAIVGTVLLGPLALFALAGKKKREMFAVEYVDPEGVPGLLSFEVKKRYGFQVENELERVVRVEVEWPDEESR